MKIHLKLLTALSFFYSFVAGATVVVNAPSPAPQHVVGDSGYQISYASGTAGNPNTLTNGAFYNSTLGYQFVDNSTSGLVVVDVSTDKQFSLSGAQGVVVTLSTAPTTGDEIPLTGASFPSGTSAPTACNPGSSTTCQVGIRNGVTYPFSAIYSPGTTLRLSFSLANLCATPGITTGTTNICASSSSVTALGASASTITQTLYVTFSVVDLSVNTNIGAVSGGTQPDSLNVTLALTNAPPSMSCPASTKIEDFYYPGDQSIIFNTGLYQTGVGTNGVPTQNILLLADRGSLAATTITANALPSAEVQDYLGIAGSREVAGGFVNTTTGSDNGYNASLYTQNSAGIYSASACQTSSFPLGQGASSADGKLRAQLINSVLTESRCFIATAAFHDGHAAPVMMLRRFRDEVLSKSEWGRNFISTYYEYSPALAEWAWDKPIIRSIALHALAPVELLAWAILKVTHAESSQPYIDHLKKKLDEDQPKSESSGESYIEQEKKKLKPTPTPTGESYIDRVKKTLDEEEKPNGYADKQKAELPPESDKDKDSAIAKVKEGRDEYPRPEREAIHNAVSFEMGVSPGMKVVNTKGTIRFEDMYGSGFQPDIVLHYERQLFHSEYFGSLGIGASLGVSYAEGFGQYTYGFGSTNSKNSRTKFSFLQIPTTIGAMYRFNLLRLLRPYVQVDGGSMNYIEVRSDAQKDKRGYSFIYEGHAGVSLLMDFMDPSTSREAYLSNGVQHTYLYAEYFIMRTMPSSPVTFERSGVYVGFLFEY